MQFFSRIREKVFYIVTGISLWLAVGNWIEYKLPLESFHILHATVKSAEARNYDCSIKWNKRRSCEQTRIQLHEYQSTFEVADREGRGAYITNVQAGDKVYLVIRHWYQYLLTFGDPNSIYHLQSEEGQVYYSIGIIKATNFGYAFFSGIMTLVFLLFLFIDRQVQKEKKKTPPPVAHVYEDKVTWE